MEGVLEAAFDGNHGCFWQIGESDRKSYWRGGQYAEMKRRDFNRAPSNNTDIWRRLSCPTSVKTRLL